MQARWRHMRVRVLLLGLAALLVAGGVALAAGDDGWVDGQEALGGQGTLTVTTVATGDVLDDLLQADVVIDIFRIASAEYVAATDSYSYTLQSPYDTGRTEELLVQASAPRAGDDDAAYEELAQAALELCALHEQGSFSIDGGIYDLPDGLYLVVPHSRGLVDAGATARSSLYEYRFKPGIVSMPDRDTSLGESAHGARLPWSHSILLSLKFERTPRFGEILITKQVDDDLGEESTFVFHLTGTTIEGKPYDNYAAVTLDGTTTGQTVVGRIPAGTWVTVDEVYLAGRYHQVSGPDGALQVLADDQVVASFVNEADVTGPDGGHGIQNHFEYDQTGTKDWDWTAMPADKTSQGA